MPALFALGQHKALDAIQRNLRQDEKLLAFHDDLYVVGPPAHMATLHNHVERELWTHARIRINHGKTQLWNRAGVFPTGCEHIIAARRAANPPVTVWRGDPDIPSNERGVRVLGTLVGHRDFVEAQVQQTGEVHAVLLSRISAVSDLQCAWLIVLFCASTRANYLLRVVHPLLVSRFRDHPRQCNMELSVRPLWTLREHSR